MNQPNPPLFVEAYISRFIRWLAGNRLPFCSALLAGLMAHLFSFTNKLISFDDTNHMFNKGYTTSSGRWGLELTSYLFPDISMPFIYGLIGLILFSLSACVIVSLFQIKRRSLQALLAASITVFPSLTATVIYMFTLAPYGISFLLAVVSVALVKTGKPGAYCTALFFMILSLSIYQSYISIASSLLVLLLIQQLLREEPWEGVFKRGLGYLLFLILSLGLYYLATTAVRQLTGIGFNEYADSRVEFSLSRIPAAVLQAYRDVLHFFTQGIYGLAPTPFSRAANALLCACSAVTGLYWLCTRKKVNVLSLGLLLLLCLLLPLTINALNFFISWESGAYHTLVLYGYVAIYVFCALLADSCPPRCTFLLFPPSEPLLPAGFQSGSALLCRIDLGKYLHCQCGLTESLFPL